MRQKAEALTYESAFINYFGSVKEIVHKPLPFKCRCGDTSFSLDKKTTEKFPIMSLEDCFTHIRHDHKERIKKLNA